MEATSPSSRVERWALRRGGHTWRTRAARMEPERSLARSSSRPAAEECVAGPSPHGRREGAPDHSWVRTGRVYGVPARRRLGTVRLVTGPAGGVVRDTYA